MNMETVRLSILFVFLLLCCFQTIVFAQADGWKMTDRFYGFRYELSGNDISKSTSTESLIQEHADSQGCFGWVQRTKENKIVGEVRCSKNRGIEFAEWMKQLKDIRNADILVTILLSCLPIVAVTSSSLTISGG